MVESESINVNVMVVGLRYSSNFGMPYLKPLSSGPRVWFLLDFYFIIDIKNKKDEINWANMAPKSNC